VHPLSSEQREEGERGVPGSAGMGERIGGGEFVELAALEGERVRRCGGARGEGRGGGEAGELEKLPECGGHKRVSGQSRKGSGARGRCSLSVRISFDT
jgi:hypothetical protein